jgi:hypothetical protein
VSWTRIGIELRIHLSTNVSVANLAELKGTSSSKKFGDSPRGSTCSLMQSVLSYLLALPLNHVGSVSLTKALAFKSAAE